MKHRKRRKGKAERFWGMLLAAAMVLSPVSENALTLTAYAEGTDEGQETPKSVSGGDASCGYECKIRPVQELIDALPDGSEITAENAADIEAQLAEIDEAKGKLTGGELDALDSIRYEAAVSALLALEGMAGADAPQTLAGAGAFTVTGGTEGTDYSFADGVLTVKSGTALTISGTSTSDRIEVESGVSANITLSNVNIDVSTTPGEAAFKIADNSDGNVTVTLEGSNTLKSGENCAGLQKNGSSGTLTIKGDGSLNVYGGNNADDESAKGKGMGAAGIGGGANGSASNITISGGTVSAYGGGTFTLIDGTICCLGGGAGIGGGYHGSGTNITISGSADITVQGGPGAAGIGGGYTKDGTVTIEGGTVTATGGATHMTSRGTGAGIGGGGFQGIGNVTIEGGTVTATGGSVLAIAGTSGNGGAGIGSGSYGSGNSNVTITGGSVKATGGNGGSGIGNGGAGIGTAGYSGSANVTISGGVVTATGGNGGSDSDSGSNSSGGAGIGQGGNPKGSATFSTTGDSGTGNAFIIATGGTGGNRSGDPITGGAPSDASGVIFQGDSGQVYGNQTLTANAEIPSGKTLTIPSGVSLTVDAALTNNGTLNNQGILTIARGGALSGNALITGSGTFRTEDLTEDMISVPEDLVYNGSDLTGIISGQIRLAVICGQAFEVTGWTPDVTKADDLHYTVTCTHTDGRKVTKTVTVKLRPLTISGAALSDKVYDGTAAAAVDSVTFTGYAEGDGELTTNDYTATAEFTDASAGKGKTATVTVTLKDTEAAGNYTLSSPVISTTGTIHPRTVAAPAIELSPDSFVWDGTEKKPAVTVKDGDTVIPDSEYTVTYADNINAGTATVTVMDNEGGNYIVGRVSESFTIEKAPREEPDPPKADTEPETGISPAEPETGTSPAEPGTGSTPAGSGTGATPARPGTGITPARPGTGATPVRPGTGNTARPGSQTGPGNGFPQETGTDTEKPFIKGEDGRTGWDVIRAGEEKAAGGSVINVDMNGATVVPGDIFDGIKGRDITITFDMDNGIIWSVDGKGITRDTSRDQAGDIDFSVKTGTDTIPADIIGNVAGESRSIQISLAHEGEFGFTAVLSINLGRENAGYAAGLYYYNESTGELEFICRDTITEDGTASLAFTHASDYVIVIDGEESGAAMEPAQTENPDGNSVTAAGETPDEDSSTAEVESPETAQAWRPWWIAAAVIPVMAVGIGLFLVVRRKKEEEDA